VHTFDLHRHLDPAAVVGALRLLEPHLGELASASGRAEAELRAHHARLLQASNGDEALAAAGIAYHAPADAGRTGLADGSVDLVISNSVLEHVPAEVLDALLAESRRILRAGGISLHGVNCGDHYAYADPRITPIHYLRYSERRWRLWNNDILFQNRLRASDFLAAAERAGLRVVLDSHRARPELLQRLHELPIDAAFRRYTPEDLCCTSIDFAATPDGARAPRAGSA
jgi:SAM-dependent methyltransferase